MTLKISGTGLVEARSVHVSVPPSAPLIKLARRINWETLIEIVLPDLKATTAKGFWHLGRNLWVRIHLGILLLQIMFDRTDREMENELLFNAQWQLFCGLGLVKSFHVPDHTKIETFRNRLRPETRLAMSNEIAKLAIELGFADPTKVDIDSTVQEANMTCPSDARLLVQLAERACRVIDWLREKSGQIVNKIDMSTIKAKAKSYFFAAKNMVKAQKRKLFADLHSIVKSEVYRAQNTFSLLSKELRSAPWNIVRALDQVQGHGRRYLLDVAQFIRTHTIKAGKRLSHHLKEVVCISKGKTGKQFEFGRVFQIGRMRGNFVWSCMNNSIRMDDKSALAPMLAAHKELSGGVKIQELATDKGYFSRKNEAVAIEAMTKDGALHLGYRYEDVDEATDTRLRDHRGGLEAIIGHCKRGQLGSCRMKSDRTTLAAGYAALGGFNLRQLSRSLIKEIA